jgi:DNA-binding NarL/FixJ family response regulator
MDRGFEIIGEVASLQAVTPLIDELKPDVLVLGLNPGDVESRQYVRQLRSIVARTRVLVLDYGASPPRLARLGITAWLAGTASHLELVAAIRAAASGYSVSGNPTVIGGAGRAPSQPTPRELEVLAMIERGLSTREIADQLRTTPRTVHFHVGNLFTKLGAGSRTEMVHLARQRQWLHEDA